MADFRTLIVGKAFKVVPGIAYNRVLEELTRETGGQTLVYEVVLPESGRWEDFREATYPSFVRYVKQKHIDPENPQQVVVAVFFQDRCYLLQGTAFLDVLREMEGLGSAALHFRLLQWLAE